MPRFQGIPVDSASAPSPRFAGIPVQAEESIDVPTAGGAVAHLTPEQAQRYGQELQATPLNPNTYQEQSTGREVTGALLRPFTGIAALTQNIVAGKVGDLGFHDAEHALNEGAANSYLYGQQTQQGLAGGVAGLGIGAATIAAPGGPVVAGLNAASNKLYGAIYNEDQGLPPEENVVAKALLSGGLEYTFNRLMQTGITGDAAKALIAKVAPKVGIPVATVLARTGIGGAANAAMQGGQNLIEGRPVTENVGNAAAQGALIENVGGMAHDVLSRGAAAETPAPVESTPAPATPGIPDQFAGTPILAEAYQAGLEGKEATFAHRRQDEAYHAGLEARVEQEAGKTQDAANQAIEKNKAVLEPATPQTPREQLGLNQEAVDAKLKGFYTDEQIAKMTPKERTDALDAVDPQAVVTKAPAEADVLAKQQELVNLRAKLERGELQGEEKTTAEKRVDGLAAEVQADLGDNEDLFDKIAAVKEQTASTRLDEITAPGDVKEVDQPKVAQQPKILTPEEMGSQVKGSLPIKQPLVQHEARETVRQAVENTVPPEGTAHKGHMPQSFNDMLTPIMSQVRDVSPPAFDRLMTMEFNTGKDREGIRRNLTPHAETIETDLGVERSRLTGRPTHTEKSLAFKRAVLNADFDTARSLLSEPAQKAFDAYTNEFERLHEWQVQKGVSLENRENYWPRFMRDHEAFDAVYGKDTGRFEEAWDLAAAQKGKALTPEEKMEIANSVVQGYGPRKPGSYGPSFARARSIEALTDEQLSHYLDPLEAAMRYVDGAVYAGNRAEFLGKNASESGLADSIGSVVEKEVEGGNLDKDQQRQLNNLLQVRFGGDMMVMTKGARRLKQAMYLTGIGQFRNAINQVLDLGVTAHSHGIKNAVSGLTQSLGLTSTEHRQFMEEIGLHDHGEEFKDVGNVARATDRALMITGFKRLDRLGKETRLNASRQHFQQAALKPSSEGFQRLQQEYEPVLGRERFTRTMQDFAEGKMTEDAKYLQFLDMTKVQPVTLSNMPAQYLKMQNGRIIYTMKTFMMNQMDYVRRDVARKLVTPGQRREGIKSAASLVTLMTLMGVGKEVTQKLLRGRTPSADDIPNMAADSLLGIIGLSRYNLTAANEKPSQGAMNLIVPPLSWVDRAYNDVKTFGDGSGFRSTQTIPIIGDLMYYWWGKGGDLSNKADVTALRNKLKALKDEAQSARDSGDVGLADQLDTIYNDRKQELPAKAVKE